MKNQLLFILILVFQVSVAQKSSDFNFFDKPSGKVKSYKEERWDVDYQLDNIILKQLRHSYSSKYDLNGILRELLTQEPIYPNTTKLLFDEMGNVVYVYYNYYNNLFDNFQHFKYNSKGQLIGTRLFEEIEKQYSHVVFSKDTNIIRGKYQLLGYMDIAYDDKGSCRDMKLAGEFDMHEYSSVFGVAFERYYKILRHWINASEHHFDYECNDGEIGEDVVIGTEYGNSKVIVRFPYTKIHQEYKYDSNGNWIERVVFICDKPVEVYKRTIDYF